jgi:hypothetical protein
MNQQATILPIAPPVVQMLTPEEESIVALFSRIIVELTINQLQDESNPLSPI